MIITLANGPLAGWRVETGTQLNTVRGEDQGEFIILPMRSHGGHVLYHFSWYQENRPEERFNSVCYHREIETVPCPCGNHPEGHQRTVWLFRHYEMYEAVTVDIARRSRVIVLP